MDIWEKSKLFIFVLFVMPGFISMKVYDVFHSRPGQDYSKTLIDVIAYSCVNYALLLVPIYYVETSDLMLKHPVWYYLFYLFTFFILPIVLPVLLIYIRTRRWFTRFMPHPTGRPWDFYFKKAKKSWVIVTLKNGKKYGGRYDSESFASSSPEPEQIYLEHHWALDADGDLDHKLSDTLGIIILTNEIESIEFIEITSTPASGM